MNYDGYQEDILVPICKNILIYLLDKNVLLGTQSWCVRQDSNVSRDKDR